MAAAERTKAFFKLRDLHGRTTPEKLATFLPSLVEGMSAKESAKLLAGVPKTRDGLIDYGVFVDWLMAGALDRPQIQAMTLDDMQAVIANLSDHPDNTIRDAVDAAIYAHQAATKAAAPASVRRTSGWLDELGGHAYIRTFADISVQINVALSLRLSENEWKEHDKIYQGLGLGKLLSDGRAMKSTFDKLCEKLSSNWSADGFPTKFIAVPVKGITRAEVKVRVSYNGQITKLNDSVRGTLCICAPPSREALKTAYAKLLDFAKNVSGLLPGIDCKLIQFKDRYQSPLGNYRDWMFKLKINGYLCELQVNFKQAIEEKESLEHKDYELQRMAEDNLLEAAMKGDKVAVILMLKTGVSPRVADSNKFTPLHYAAAHADLEMCLKLIEAGSDITAMDCTGALCVHRAVAQDNCEVAGFLFDALTKAVTGSDVQEDLRGALTTLWDMMLQKPAFSELESIVFSFMTERMNYVPGEIFLRSAKHGCSKSCHALVEMGQERAPINHHQCSSKSGHSFHPMDYAIVSGKLDVVEALMHAGAPLFPDGTHHPSLQLAAEEYVVSDHVNALEAAETVAKHIGTPLDLKPLLILAASRRSKNTVRMLLRRGLRLSTRPKELEYQLRAAAVSGDLDFMELLLDANVDVDTAQLSVSALYSASDIGQIHSVKLLVSRQANVNMVNTLDREVSLHCSACNTQLKVVKLLLESRADPTIKSCCSPPLEMAKAQSWNPQVIALMEDYSVVEKPCTPNAGEEERSLGG